MHRRAKDTVSAVADESGKKWLLWSHNLTTTEKVGRAVLFLFSIAGLVYGANKLWLIRDAKPVLRELVVEYGKPHMDAAAAVHDTLKRSIEANTVQHQLFVERLGFDEKEWSDFKEWMRADATEKEKQLRDVQNDQKKLLEVVTKAIGHMEVMDSERHKLQEEVRKLQNGGKA